MFVPEAERAEDDWQSEQVASSSELILAQRPVDLRKQPGKFRRPPRRGRLCSLERALQELNRDVPVGRGSGELVLDILDSHSADPGVPRHETLDLVLFAPRIEDVGDVGLTELIGNVAG